MLNSSMEQVFFRLDSSMSPVWNFFCRNQPHVWQWALSLMCSLYCISSMVAILIANLRHD